nr:serine incorporator 5-like [Salvelinus alpinus]
MPKQTFVTPAEFWFPKFVVLLACCVGGFFLPEQDTFLEVWRYVGAVGGFLFLLIQLMLLVEFAHRWNTNWSSGVKDNRLVYGALARPPWCCSVGLLSKPKESSIPEAQPIAF